MFFNRVVCKCKPEVVTTWPLNPMFYKPWRQTGTVAGVTTWPLNPMFYKGGRWRVIGIHVTTWPLNPMFYKKDEILENQDLLLLDL